MFRSEHYKQVGLKEDIEDLLGQLENVKRYTSVLEKAKQNAVTELCTVRKEKQKVTQQAKSKEQETSKRLRDLDERERTASVHQRECRVALKKMKDLEQANAELKLANERLIEEVNSKNARLASLRNCKSQLESKLDKEAKENERLQHQLHELGHKSQSRDKDQVIQDLSRKVEELVRENNQRAKLIEQ